MDFKKASDELISAITIGQIAQALDRSEATIKQARLAPTANAHRSPPEGWEAALARLARQRAAALLKLADKLK
jgi:hypothetical protein